MVRAHPPNTDHYLVKKILTGILVNRFLFSELTRGRTDHFVTYLHFPIQVCFSSNRT